MEVKTKINVANLIRTPGFKITGVEFDVKSITPRILNRAIKFINIGYTIGNGASVSLAQTLSQLFDLGIVHTYSTVVHVPANLSAENQEKIKSIVTADHTGYLLSQQKSNRTRVYHSRGEDRVARAKEIYTNNLWYLEHKRTGYQNPGANGLTTSRGVYIQGLVFWTEDNMIEALRVLNSNVLEPVRKKRDEVVAQLQKGEIWSVKF